MNKVEKVISKIRNSHIDNKWLYENGQCYNFSLILYEIFDNVEIWYDQVQGHVYSKIGKCWYDINGKHVKVPKTCFPLNHYYGHRPHRWGKNDRRRLCNL